MCLEDIKGILEIENACFTADAWSEEAFAFRLDIGEPRFYNLVVDDNDFIAGYITASFVAGEINIDSVAIADSYRRKGLASELINTAIQISRAELAMLEVRESNQAAIALYEALGFKEVGIRRDYYDLPTENAVLMTKSIEN